MAGWGGMLGEAAVASEGGTAVVMERGEGGEC